MWIVQCSKYSFYGDKEAFVNKFRTCARNRRIKNQLLGEDFNSREHTKPLFKEHNTNFVIHDSVHIPYLHGTI